MTSMTPACLQINIHDIPRSIPNRWLVRKKETRADKKTKPNGWLEQKRLAEENRHPHCTTPRNVPSPTHLEIFTRCAILDTRGA